MNEDKMIQFADFLRQNRHSTHMVAMRLQSERLASWEKFKSTLRKRKQ